MNHLLVALLVLSPLVGASITGLFGRYISVKLTHRLSLFLVGLSFLAALCFCYRTAVLNMNPYYENAYEWALAGGYHFYLGFWIDRLSAMMSVIVTFVSFLVHLYSIGYMRDDPGYQRFFSYMSLFTFAMLLLVTSNNMLQLFIGWEGVGLVSYLLIGFWFKKPSAANGSFKAFIVNRVGDFGFIIGLAALFGFTGSLDYQNIFQQAPALMAHSMSLGGHGSILLINFICLMLFIGAMGKSAQLPLHIWLPESMEGPTPISALIHAATMVTAGIFMVARLSPLFSLSPQVLSLIMIIGATGALFLGLLAVVEFDIKRVVAYSTMSQLGYMMAANGAGAYPVAIFHLFTHACFKALLFLAAGSVIMAMHHEQDVRQMGGLRKRLPLTYACFLIGTLALVAVPPFAGFYSKDAIIDAVHLSTLYGAHYAYLCLALGALVTALYSFRVLFLAFHGTPRMSDSAWSHVKENTWQVGLPLVVLSVPSVLLGLWWAKPLLYSTPGFFSSSFVMVAGQNPLAIMAGEFHGLWALVLEALHGAVFYLTISGIGLAYVLYIYKPHYPAMLSQRLSYLVWVLNKGYGFDRLNQILFVNGANFLSHRLYHYADMALIDKGIVDASGQSVVRLSYWLRRMQTGYLFHYILGMIVGLLCLMLWFFL